MEHRQGVLAIPILAVLAFGCGNKEAERSPVAAAVEQAKQEADAIGGGIRGVIANQIELMKAGDLDALKLSFTERLRGKITSKTVAAGLENLKGKELDELVGKIDMQLDANGHGSCTITMASGRTLTTLVRDSDRWLADTLWFK